MDQLLLLIKERAQLAVVVLGLLAGDGQAILDLALDLLPDILEVQMVSEGPARLEIGLQESMLALQLPLRLGIPSIKDDPADLQLAAERQEWLAGLATPGYC